MGRNSSENRNELIVFAVFAERDLAQTVYDTQRDLWLLFLCTQATQRIQPGFLQSIFYLHHANLPSMG